MGIEGMGTRVPRDRRIRSSIALCMTLTPSMSEVDRGAVTEDSRDNDDDSNAVVSVRLTHSY